MCPRSLKRHYGNFVSLYEVEGESGRKIIDEKLCSRLIIGINYGNYLSKTDYQLTPKQNKTKI